MSPSAVKDPLKHKACGFCGGEKHPGAYCGCPNERAAYAQHERASDRKRRKRVVARNRAQPTVTYATAAKRERNLERGIQRRGYVMPGPFKV